MALTWNSVKLTVVFGASMFSDWMEYEYLRQKTIS
jgi:hypothetical protein